MARKTPQARSNPRAADDGERGYSETKVGGDDDGEEEEEEGDEDDDDGDDGDDRGDDHDPGDDDEGDEGDDDEEEEEDDDGDDEGDDDDGEEEEDEGDDSNVDDLRHIAGDGTVPVAVVGELRRQVRDLTAALGQQQRGGAAGDGGKPNPPEFDIKAKRKERNAKLLEGDEEAAAEIDEEIDAYNRQSIIAAATQQAADAAAGVIQREKINSVIADVQAKYPVLNDRKAKAFDQDVLDEVCALRDVYIKRGEPFEKALRMAAKRICERDPGDDRRERPRQQGALTLRQKREQMQRASRQAPRLSRHGAGGRPAESSGSLSEDQIRGMSDQKFRRMDPRTKAEERGDNVGSGGKRRRSRSGDDD